MERRSVLLRVESTVDPVSASSELEESGADVTSAAGGVVAAAVTPAALTRIMKLPWVLSIQEPRSLRAIEHA
jgi:hypothetical protein